MAEWQRAPIADAAARSGDALVDGPFGSNLKAEEYVESGVRLVQLQNVGQGHWIDRAAHYISDAKAESLRRHQGLPGDIAIAKMAEPVARACRLPPHEKKFVVVADCIRLRVDEERYDPKFVTYAINSDETRSEAEAAATGSTRVRINLAQLKRISIAAPPLEEQRRIAEILDTVDETIQATERVIGKLWAACSGAIDELLRPGRGPDDAPPSWSRGIVGDFLHLQRGFDITKDAQRSGDVPVVSSSGIASYHDEAKVKGPGVVTGRKGKLGDAYFIPVDYWPHDTSLWVTDFKGNDPKFIALFLRSLRLQRFDAATSVPTLNRNVVHPLRAAIPSLEEQRQIVAVNDEYEDRVETEKRVLQELIAIRAGLAADLLSGRMRTVAT